MLTTIRRLFDQEAWLDGLPAQGGALDRQFARALRRGVHMPYARRTWLDTLLPWRRQRAEVIDIAPPRRMPPLPAAAATMSIESAAAALLGDARIRARDEVARHVDSLPRGRERAEKFSALTIAHEIRTTRVVETELFSELRAAGEPVPAIDYRARLEGEKKALEAEIAAERTAETYAPLTERELDIRQGQLALVRLLLAHDDLRGDLMRRRAVRPAGSVSGTTSDGGQDAPQRRSVSIDLGMEL